MRWLVLLALAGPALAACGSSEPAPLPPACAGTPAAFLRALRAAPHPVRLAGGVALSTCVQRGAGDEADLQTLGLTLTPVADTLAARGTTTAAVELGYLTGAVRRGAGRTNGVAAQLAHRIEHIAARAQAQAPDPALLTAARLGIAAGEGTG